MLLINVLGGLHPQLPALSSTKLFLHAQNPKGWSYFSFVHDKQSKYLGPLQVRQLESHFWHTIFYDDLSS